MLVLKKTCVSQKNNKLKFFKIKYYSAIINVLKNYKYEFWHCTLLVVRNFFYTFDCILFAKFTSFDRFETPNVYCKKWLIVNFFQQCQKSLKYSKKKLCYYFVKVTSLQLFSCQNDL